MNKRELMGYLIFSLGMISLEINMILAKCMGTIAMYLDQLSGVSVNDLSIKAYTGRVDLICSLIVISIGVYLFVPELINRLKKRA